MLYTRVHGKPLHVASYVLSSLHQRFARAPYYLHDCARALGEMPRLAGRSRRIGTQEHGDDDHD